MGLKKKIKQIRKIEKCKYLAETNKRAIAARTKPLACSTYFLNTGVITYYYLHLVLELKASEFHFSVFFFLSCSLMKISFQCDPGGACVCITAGLH